MSTVEIESKERVAVLRLTNGVTNAIGPELVEDLTQALDKVRERFRGLVLAGGEKFFSIGFDLPRLLDFDRPRMSDFFYRFNNLSLRLLTLPIPTCCAVSGHGTAGGTILALTCDYRYAAGGKKFLGLNEIKLGVPVPYLADLMLRQVVTDRAANDIVYRGEFLTTSEAKEIGLVNALFPQEEVEQRALDLVSGMAELPQAAFSAMKENRLESIRKRYGEEYKTKNENFLKCWFSDSVQGLLEEASKKF